MAGIPAAELTQLPVRWTGSEELPVLMVNNFLIQFDVAGGRPDLLILTAGQALPPPVMGSPEERKAAVEELGVIDIRAVAQFSLTESRLDELISALLAAKAVLDEARNSQAAPDVDQVEA